MANKNSQFYTQHLALCVYEISLSRGIQKLLDLTRVREDPRRVRVSRGSPKAPAHRNAASAHFRGPINIQRAHDRTPHTLVFPLARALSLFPPHLR